jgi:molecular chaperone DnaJ
MNMPRDYYEILGLSKGATPAEIKKSYRKLAREHHPDMVAESDKKEAEARFKEINEAYQVLSDSEKKQMYDQYGHAAPGFGGGQGQGFPGGGQGGQWGPFTYSYSSGGGNPFGGQQDFDPFDIFEQFFGFRGYGGQRAPRKGKNLSYEMVIDFKDAVFGIEKEINIESGKVKIKIPAGIHDGAEIKFAGKGMPGPKGLPPGDLYIVARYRSPSEFQVVGKDIFVPKELDFVTAILGGTVDVHVVDVSKKTGLGKAKLKIPSGTQHGTKFAIRGKGMPKIRGSGQGDVLVQVAVEIPKKVNRKQRKILEEYKKS